MSFIFVGIFKNGFLSWKRIEERRIKGLKKVVS
jgi:hypothetical protein